MPANHSQSKESALFRDENDLIAEQVRPVANTPPVNGLPQALANQASVHS
jgi:hypothetical protein